MNVQGFIKEIGVPREWDSREGQKMYSYPIVVSLPYIDKNGTERSDEIIGELNAGNPDYIQKLKDLWMKNAKGTFSLGLAVREYNGRKFQNIKIWDIQIQL